MLIFAFESIIWRKEYWSCIRKIMKLSMVSVLLPTGIIFFYNISKECDVFIKETLLAITWGKFLSNSMFSTPKQLFSRLFHNLCSFGKKKVILSLFFFPKVHSSVYCTIKKLLLKSDYQNLYLFIITTNWIPVTLEETTS